MKWLLEAISYPEESGAVLWEFFQCFGPAVPCGHCQYPQTRAKGVQRERIDGRSLCQGPKGTASPHNPYARQASDEHIVLCFRYFGGIVVSGCLLPKRPHSPPLVSAL